ncbi:phosphomannomutase/phosphoglucomutase [Candidatus Micrarchaeota archaeon]|nr:phosphomannomutase/phosphoglucomutase [Candidatus Micrarchaeota archaeon]
MPEIRVNPQSNSPRSLGGNPEDSTISSGKLCGSHKSIRICDNRETEGGSLPPAVPPGIFREYDVRGYVGQDLDDSVYFRIGQAFGSYLQERSGSKSSCVVGRDNRPSSPAYADAFIRGLQAVGCDVTDIGVCTTPEIYFANSFLKTTGGAAITASHNPPKYNGVKFTYDGKSAGGEHVRRVRDLAIQDRFSSGAGTLESRDIRAVYLDALRQGAPDLSGIRVVLDCGNGVSSLFAPVLFRSLGVDVIELHCDASKPFAVHLPDPADPDNYTDLSAAVLTHRAHVGLMFDGDGDRVGAVDEKGRIVAPDQLLVLFSRRFLARNPSERVIVEIKCSQAVEDEIKALGGTAVWSPTGRTLIEDVLFSKDARLAGEMSGHFFFLDGAQPWLSESLYAARQVLEIIRESGALSNQVASLPKYVSSREYRLDVPDERKFDVVRQLADGFKARHEVLQLDGAKVLFSDGWGLVRASNSEAKISLRFESKTQSGLDAIMGEFRDALKQKGIVVPF